MSKILSEFVSLNAGRGPKPKGVSKYAPLFDGRVHMLERGVDFANDGRHATAGLYAAAQVANVRIRATATADRIIVQKIGERRTKTPKPAVTTINVIGNGPMLS